MAQLSSLQILLASGFSAFEQTPTGAASDLFFSWRCRHTQSTLRAWLPSPHVVEHCGENVDIF